MAPQITRLSLVSVAAYEYKHADLGRCQSVTVHLLKLSLPSDELLFFFVGFI